MMSADVPLTDEPVPPHASGDTESANAISTSVVKASEFIELDTGKELSFESSRAIALSTPVRWIVVAGPVGCGKTTLLTSLYELFQFGPIAEYSFAGSKCLPAFEERCHESRMDSGNLEPDTQRTRYMGNTPDFLHLSICTFGDKHRCIDFLFTDVSGELFEHVRDSIDETKQLAFLQQADEFLLLLDSAKGIKVDQKWGMVRECETVLRSCLDSGMLPAHCHVNVLWAKFDYFASDDTKAHKDFRSEVERDFRAKFGGRVKQLDFGTVAARPEQAPALRFGHGVPNLLDAWFTASDPSQEMAIQPVAKEGKRESELFMIRHFMDTGAS